MRLMSSAGVIVAVSAMPGMARAAAWSFTGSGSLAAAYDDNILFVADQPLADSIGRAEFTANLARVSDRSRWVVAPRLVAVEYDRYHTYSHSEQYLTLSNLSGGERAASNLSFNLTRDTTLTSELGLTGLASTNKRRQSSNLSWSPSLQATQQWAYGAQLGATAVRYADAAHTSLVDYNYGALSLYTSYLPSPISKLTLQLSGGRLRVPDNGIYDNSNYAATIGYERALGERWRLSLSGGPSQIRGAAATADRGEVYAASVARQLEHNSFTLSISREVTPNGLGLLSRHEQLTLGAQQALSERLSFRLNGIWARTRNVAPGGGLQQFKLEYRDVVAALNWDCSPTWHLTVDLGHGQQAFDSAAATARRWHASLGVGWSGLERVLH